MHDKTKSLQKELDELQSELERILYLLKIADPGGEAARRRESVASEGKPDMYIPPSIKKPSAENHKTVQKQNTDDITTKANKNEESSEVVTNATELKATV